MKRIVIFCAAIAQIICQPATASETTEVGLLTLVGLEAAGGKTTLGEKSGEMESFSIASSLLRDAGSKLRSSLKTGTYIVLTDDQTVNLALPKIVSGQVENMQMRLTNAIALTPECKSKKPKTNKNVKINTLDDSFGGIASAVLGAIKTDTSITGIVIDPNTQALINAVTSSTGVGKKAEFSASWIIPSERIMPSSGLLAEKWARVVNDANIRSTTSCGKAEPLKSVISSIAALDTSLMAPVEKGAPSPLEQAVLWDGFALDTAQVLRLRIEKAGGSVVNKSNIWTTLGFNGLSMSGALVVSYRVTDPGTGAVTGSDVLTCRRPAASFQAINSAGVETPNADRCVGKQ
jgi:hypothetical protein